MNNLVYSSLQKLRNKKIYNPELDLRNFTKSFLKN